MKDYDFVAEKYEGLKPKQLIYDGTPPQDIFAGIEPILSSGQTPVVLRHQLGFAKPWLLEQFPGSHFLVTTRPMGEWLSSVWHFEDGLYFFYLDPDTGDELEAPPDYVGQELDPQWWHRADWWQRAIAHYWAYLGSSLEYADKAPHVLAYTANHIQPSEITSFLEGTWAADLIPHIQSFKSSELIHTDEYTPEDMKSVWDELCDLGPWQPPWPGA